MYDKIRELEKRFDAAIARTEEEIRKAEQLLERLKRLNEKDETPPPPVAVVPPVLGDGVE